MGTRYSPAAFWRRASLRTKIHLSYLALISLPLLVVAFAAYETSTNTIKQNAQEFSARLTGEIRKNLDTYEQQAQRLTYWPFQALDVQQVLRDFAGRPRGTPGLAAVSVMRSQLSYLGHIRSDVAGVYVVTRNGALFDWTASGDLVLNPPTITAAWYRAALAGDPRIIFLPTQSQAMIAVTTGRVISLVRAIRDPHSGQRLGAVRIDIAARALASVVQRVSLGSQGRLLVVTPGGQVVYPIDPSAAMQRLAHAFITHKGPAATDRLQLNVAGQALLATYDTSTSSGWMVVGVVPTAQLLSGVDHLRAFILTVVLLCILAGALCATLVVARLTQPLLQLRGAMRRVEARGDLDTRIEVRSEDEVGQLAHSFNTMLDELRRLVDDVLQAQIHEREAELHALQNQINPHFLYNTLESINMLALSHDDRDISRMVTSLGRLLRLTISSSEVLISLRDELEYVNHYLVVQRMRYGDRITMTVDVDADLLDCLLPKLTLQPLVENALYHGLEPQRGHGHVIVHGQRDGTDILLTVEDDGVGMAADLLARVQEQLLQPAPRGSRSASVGLLNVYQRLKLYCGPGYGLTITSAIGAGTQVAVRIPHALAATPRRAPAAKAAVKEGRDDVSLAHRR